VVNDTMRLTPEQQPKLDAITEKNAPLIAEAYNSSETDE
jgi:hypothetical protein